MTDQDPTAELRERMARVIADFPTAPLMRVGGDAAYPLADALIAAGFGDVAAERARYDALNAVIPHIDNHHAASLCPYCSRDWEKRLNIEGAALAEKRVTALQARIDAAPHTQQCAVLESAVTVTNGCTCWKSADNG